MQWDLVSLELLFLFSFYNEFLLTKKTKKQKETLKSPSSFIPNEKEIAYFIQHKDLEPYDNSNHEMKNSILLFFSKNETNPQL